MPRPVTFGDIFVGLGSNVGKRWDALRSAVELLAAHPLLCIEALSAVYESDPLYYVNQRRFLNMVASLTSILPPGRLLQALKDIERRMGRRRTFPNGPRVIDLDILYFGGRNHTTKTCTIPHPRLSERRFVLVPLADIAPGFVDPLSGHAVSQLLAECPDESTLRRLTRKMRIPKPQLAPAA